MCSHPQNRLSHISFLIMGTRSRIGIQLKDDSILSVYCHWDGYPSFNGKVLREFYNTKEKVTQLINGGNISSLHTNVGWNNETLPETGPQYYTSRGESIDDNAPETSKDHGEYLQLSGRSDEEFSYLFADGEWLCYNTRTGMKHTWKVWRSLLGQLHNWHTGTLRRPSMPL